MAKKEQKIETQDIDKILKEQKFTDSKGDYEDYIGGNVVNLN